MKSFQISFMLDDQKTRTFAEFENAEKAIAEVTAMFDGKVVSNIEAVEIPLAEDLNSKTFTLEDFGPVRAEKQMEDGVTFVLVSLEYKGDEFKGRLGVKDGITEDEAWSSLGCSTVARSARQLVKGQERKKTIKTAIASMLLSLLDDDDLNCNDPDCYPCQKARSDNNVH